MSFERKRFLGLTVVDFSSSVGWNDSESSITINLAPEDDETIDHYDIGRNYQFKMGDTFIFNGFLDRVIEKHNTGGFTYEVKLNDGKDLIRNVECVTKIYGTSDSKEDYPIINLFNVFRYYESQEFGLSQSNENGIPYSKFEKAINYLSAKYGIWSADRQFSIQLDFADKLPPYYRIDIPNINLMDAISKICDDLGLLYRIVLEGTVFKIKTTSLAQDAANQKVNDVIKDLAKNRNVISWDAGVESANNVDSNFILWGGQKEHAYTLDANLPKRIKQFLGYDRNGTAYWVSTDYITYISGCPFNGATLSFPDFKYKSHPEQVGAFKFPVRGLEDIILSNDGLFITIDVVEAAIILGENQDTWELYLEIRQDQGKDFLYQQIYLKPPRYNISNVANFIGYGGSEESPVKRSFGERESDTGVIRGTRVFAYLKQTLSAYLGKSFIVPVNYDGFLTDDFNCGAVNPTSKSDGLIAAKQKLEWYYDQDQLALSDPLTQKVKKTYNIVPSDSGWMEPSTLKALINPEYPVPQEYLDGLVLDANGKINNYMIFKKPPGSGNFIFENSEESFLPSEQFLWVKCNVNPEYAIINGEEHFLVTISNSVTVFDERIINEMGYFYATNCIFGVSNKNMVLGQSLSIKTGLLPISPRNLIINVKSTRNDFYGPWYFASTKTKGGKTKIEKDESLVPWAFNSSSILEKSALGRLKDIVPIPYMETGTLNKVGLPDKNLGDEIVANGPVLTSISCTYGASGITTNYSFRTFTPKFGLPSRYITERLKKTAVKVYSDRKNILALYNESLKKVQAISRRSKGFGIQSFFLDFLGRRHDRYSPHSNIVMAQIGYNFVNPVKTLGSTLSWRETNAAIHLQSGNNRNKGAISLDGLFSPFKNFSDGDLTSETQDPAGTFKNTEYYIPNSYTYNPFQVNSYISNLLSENGNEYNNLNQEPGQYTYYEASGIGTKIISTRAIALRGPIMVSGWGTNLFSRDTVPNEQAGRTAQAFTGPVDLIWDAQRGVWTSHDILVGKSNAKINQYGIGEIDIRTIVNGIYINSGALVSVKNLGKEVPAGSSVAAKYSVYDATWYVEGQGCGIRYSEAECGANVTPEGDSDFKITRSNSGDYKECKDFLCYDFLETNGFTGSTSIGGKTLKFKNGLLKSSGTGGTGDDCIKVLVGVKCDSSGTLIPEYDYAYRCNPSTTTSTTSTTSTTTSTTSTTTSTTTTAEPTTPPPGGFPQSKPYTYEPPIKKPTSEQIKILISKVESLRDELSIVYDTLKSYGINIRR